ncbi:DEAD/DEAH box helicase family protein [Hymenobacter aerilatus]|uniref:DEAD/DEAH box helicase family protein n=1 Tax=Hymenobacter aerilatus TaxID=2932251 RepID=A0A8T9SZ93_9BACT|nr:helicase-related protein [Hymenobacter aerilatus]UOR07408.1 DEAD/DEAH box helicase family protein [Hymenobacter aerilatus]
MADTSLETPLLLGRDDIGRLAYGAGPGVGMRFVKEYFPQTQQVLRIATAYFTLRGYKLGREFVAPIAQLHILVGRSEEKHAYEAVIDEIEAELGQCDTDLMAAVTDLLQRIRTGRFFIREARSMQVPFHCKIYLIDEQLVWHGSCNYTYKGLCVSAEQVSVSYDKPQVQAWISWYDQVATQAHNLLRELEKRLDQWQLLATPFDAYLKMLLLLDHLPELPKHNGAFAPAFYQRGVIARALRQEQDFGGSLIVAATGLGKTIIGAEIAGRLQVQGRIRQTILIAPTGVLPEWEQQLDGRDVRYKHFTPQVVFRKASEQERGQVHHLDKVLRQADQHTLLLIDEAHFYRNQLLVDVSAKRDSRVYNRLLPLVAAGARVVLLTATVYGTSYQNLNSLLHLLPHSPDESTGHPLPRSVRSHQQFLALPVTTVLGLPHVLKLARNRGDVDNQGRTFIQFEHERRYLPRFMRLRTVSYQLLMLPEMERAAESRCFDQQFKVRHLYSDDATLQHRVGLTDAVYNTTIGSWLSSPAAASLSLIKNLGSRDATGQRGTATDNKKRRREPKAFETPLWLASDTRQQHLAPLLTALQQLSTPADDKYQAVARIVERHCVVERGKVLLFVNRLSTAIYLKKAFEQQFTMLRIGCTVEEARGVARLASPEQRRTILTDFSPKSHHQMGRDKYEVLLCTDADGVGVNLQDCATVVNYDPPSGADVLFQRVGRILRMTTDPTREVHVYTLAPSLLTENGNRSRVAHTVRELFERITQRHEKSRSITGAAVYAPGAQTDIQLDGDIDAADFVQQDELLTDIGGLGAKSALTHTATLERYRSQAVTLPSFLLSACTYSSAQPRVIVLIQHGTSYRLICYNCKKQQLETQHQDWELLDWVRSEPTACKAPVAADQVEYEANQAVKRWAIEQQIEIGEVIKRCAIYLLPARQRHHQVRQLLRSLTQ